MTRFSQSGRRGAILWFVPGFAAALLATACASGPEPEHAGNAVVGKGVAEEFCSSCHAIGMTGESPDRAAPPFRDILKHYPARQLAADLRNSKSMSYLHMPQFFFGDDHPADLVAYMRSLEHAAAAPPHGPVGGS